MVEYKHLGNIVTKLLVKSQGTTVNMAEVMKFCLTPVPYCIGIADGYLAKTNKAVGYSFITKGVMDEQLPNAGILTIEDGNVLFYCLKEVPDTFKQICTKLYNMTKMYGDVVFSTDMYSKNYVKTLERKWRGITEKLLVKGANTKKTHDLKTFLNNEENKEQLIGFMHTCWSELVPDNRSVILIKNGEAFNIGQEENISGLRSNQEETDSRIVLYCIYAAEQGYQYVTGAYIQGVLGVRRTPSARERNA